MTRIVFVCLGILSLGNFAQAKDNTPPNLIAGKKVAAGDTIKKGDRLVGVWERKNYLIEVLEIRRHGRLRVLWGGELYDDIDPTDLYYIGEDTPTRKKRASPLPAAYQAYDKNGDGQIGLYEWDRTKYAEFKRLDKNHDGFLTPQELAEKPSIAANSSSGTATDTTATGTKELETQTTVQQPDSLAGENLPVEPMETLPPR